MRQSKLRYHIIAISGLPIAGDRVKGTAPKSSDGMVPYGSSLQPAAQSEKIVASHHGAHRHPDAIEEVHRILTFHAR